MGLQSIGLNFQRSCALFRNVKPVLQGMIPLLLKTLSRAAFASMYLFVLAGWNAQQLGKSLVVAEKKQSTVPIMRGRTDLSRSPRPASAQCFL